MKIGAIVVHWNSCEYLEKCLSSLCAQTVPFDKIILIDNGSTTLNLPSELLKKCKYIKVGYNSGFAKANNIGIDLLSDCRWVALVNPDAYLDNDWLQKIIEAKDSNPKFDILSSRLISAKNTSVIDGDGDKYHISGFAWRYRHGKPRITNDNKDNVKEVFSACAAAVLYRYSALEAVGFFDEDYFCYFEDVDLGFRLRLVGHRCLQVPDAIAYHVGYASSNGRHSEFAVYHGHRNLVWTYIKNMPGILFWIFLPLHLTLNIFSLFWFSLLRKGRVIGKCKIDAIKKFELMWKKRKKIQEKRKASIADILRAMDKGLIRRH